ncbi:hypothetical protein FQN49_002042 [Arthroderma sp. PD_2]|nr:hypothetical protein FQN49_002042 [Arthroderma sp. PD_2]
MAVFLYHRLSWWLLLAFSRAMETPAFPQIVEVDLVFPRNETYAPVPFLPYVFAVQNFHAAKSLFLSFEYTLEKIPSDNIEYTPGRRSLQHANFSGSDLHIEWDYTDRLRQPGNDFGNSEVNYINGSHTRGHHDVYFTSKKGGQQPDLVAATQDVACNKTVGDTFNITQEVESPPVLMLYKTQPLCPILSTISPPPKPCGVKINATKASDIFYTIQSRECDGGYSRRTTCPPGVGKKNAASRAEQSSAGRLVWLMVTLGLLTYVA